MQDVEPARDVLGERKRLAGEHAALGVERLREKRSFLREENLSR
jgi:hypothetical protein